jgi:hypothetical protein
MEYSLLTIGAEKNALRDLVNELVRSGYIDNE